MLIISSSLFVPDVI